MSVPGIGPIISSAMRRRVSTSSVRYESRPEPPVIGIYHSSPNVPSR
jgi:hypothetical protein